MKIMWEILVPTIREDGRPFRLRYHRVWDEMVKEITGGLSIFTPAKGVWVSPMGETIKERMIPVRIFATREEIDRIVDFTLAYYEQQAILCYKVSDEVILRYREDHAI